jgi:hypothetical protein
MLISQSAFTSFAQIKMKLLVRQALDQGKLTRTKSPRILGRKFPD